ncbi:hypothetical protein CANINC_003231 [Pichia inconspicua]|uniref:Zn(2)-C6 fungal-type domain-containing protein n=1 Tax=Pichia inconspicua TaxID=52247 RepID=A0A4V4NFI6_9ASCO|nr:hypothetical protein CANINC_003231 [[Candida] inconspicua]
MSNLKDGSLKTEEEDNFGSYSDSTQNNGNDKSKRHSKRFKKIACTECRQQKAKCDASDKAPEPCSRCVKRGIPCRLDSDFKRTFKRAKIDELVKEYEIIKSKLHRKPNNVNKEVSPITSYISPINSQHPVFNTNNFNVKSAINNSSPIPSDSSIFYATAQNSSYGNVVIPSNQNSKYKVGSPLQLQHHLPVTKAYSPLGMNLLPSNSPLNPDTNHPIMPVPTSHSPYITTSTTPVPLPTTSLPRSNTPTSINRMNSNLNFSTLITAANSQEINHGPSIKMTNNDSTNYSSTKVDNRAVRKPEINPTTLTCTPKILADVSLNEDQIVILYSTFLTYYHPLLPVIDMEKNIDLIYRLCPALFWTIMLTALRGHHSLDPVINSEERQSLYFKLAPVLKSVLAEISISPITRYAPSEVDEPILNASSVYSVQAFLIYTFWPPLTSSLSADSSWNTIGIAFYQAIRTGLHTPGLSSDRVKVNNEDLMSEQIRTWIACNVVSETVGTVFGFPAFFQPYGSLALSLSLPNEEAIPHCLKQMLEIQTFDEQVKKTLNNNSLDPLRLNQASERLPMIHLLETELNNLELRLCSPTSRYIDDFRLLALYSSRLRLFSYNFLDNDEIASFELKRGFIKTYNAALAIVQHCKQSQERDSSFIPNLPNVYILTIWQASVVIVRLVYSPYKNILDIAAGKTLYQTAINLILKASVMKHDLAYRACGIMKSTWSLFKTLDETQPSPLKVTVRSRMSVNIFFDTLWILREKCGMISLKQRKEKNSVSGESAHSDSEVDVIDEDNEVDTTKISENDVSVSNKNRESRSCSKESSISSKKKNYHPESAARRIISTIPLDPQPIALAETPQDSGSSSRNASPYAKSPYVKSPSDSIKKIITPQSLVHNAGQNSPDSRGASAKPNTPVESVAKTWRPSKLIQGSHENNITNGDSKSADAPNDTVEGTTGTSADFLVDSWDIGYDLDSDMLFKDIESVMDEFGFHTAY